jgi:Tol biopolymer transport system component
MLAGRAWLLGLVTYGAVFGVCFAQTPPPARQQIAPARKTETFWHKVLRVSGIAQSPSTLKGPGDEVERGQIWVADLAGGKTRKLTSSGGFRSPVFLPEGNDVLALKGTNVVRVALSDGKATNLFTVTGLTKLVGFSEDNADKVLVVSRDGSGHPGVAFLSVSTGKLDPLPYEPSSGDDRHLVEHLSAWDRHYGDTIVYTDQQTKTGMAGTLSWADVFLKKGSSAAKDVSNCDGINCGQPSLSPDGKLVAFVRSDED